MFRTRTLITALLLTVLCLLTTSATADVIYVDDDAPTGGDGLSWQTAFTDLQDAITHASTNGAVTRIHVAEGTYTPDPGGTNRDAAFTMINGVAICGGYAGLSAPEDPNQRDISDHETILSGNIGNPDYQSDNSYHLFYHYDGLGLDHTAILNGFTLANANADGAAPNDSGAAIYNYANSPTVIRCLFIDNRAVSYGGAIYNFGLSNPTIFNCRFVHNQALQGAGMWNHGCTDLLVCGSTFQNNNAVLHGGAAWNYGGSPTFTNSTFYGNGAVANGGGMYNSLTSPTITNCIFWANNSPQGAQIYNSSTAYPEITYSCVQDGFSGTGNISSDPGITTTSLRLPSDSPCIDAGDNDALPADTYDLDDDGDTTEPYPLDLQNWPRVIRDPVFHNTTPGLPPIVDMGAYEFASDCNSNDLPDIDDVHGGFSLDCNQNIVPDECETGGLLDCNANSIPDLCDLYEGDSPDCNHNLVPDECDLVAGTSYDCNETSIPDECEIESGYSQDCNSNQSPDECDLADETSSDCNENEIPDECDISSGASQDCNLNGTPDECDVASEVSSDCNQNGIPDDCEPGGTLDCNYNSVPDLCDLFLGDSLDCNENAIPDECDVTVGTSPDCNETNIPDECEIAAGTSQDCNINAIPDECDINLYGSNDHNTNSIPDECESDCNSNGLPDDMDLASGLSYDANSNGMLDECEIPIFVDDSATNGLNNGRTWTDAYLDLQDALDEATSNPRIKEIKIAQGVYRPDRGTGDQMLSFQIPEGTALYGGYAGVSSSTPNSRDIDAYRTVLTGYLGSDYPPDGPWSPQTSRLVIFIDEAIDGVALDGFTVDQAYTCGLRAYSSNIRISRCHFTNSVSGASISRSGCVTITNCTFDSNGVNGFGVGLAVHADYGTVASCTFANNPGGAFNVTGNTQVVDCVFMDHPTVAVSVYAGSNPASTGPRFVACRFLRNAGAIVHESGDIALINCFFNGNTSSQGAAFYSQYGSGNLEINGCTFTNNTAGQGGAIYVQNTSLITTIENSIIWGNSDNGGTGQSSQLRLNGSSSLINYSIVQNWIGDIRGDNTSDSDPLFVDLDGPDDISGTEDDDPHLLPTSPAINAGNPSYVPNSPMTDLDGQPRVQHCCIDIGVDETPYFYDDCNNNGISDFCDLTEPETYDLNSDGVVDSCERTLFVNQNVSAGTGTGDSWPNAFTDLQDALAEAHANNYVRQIWVAAGTYMPDNGTGDQTISFDLSSGLNLYGGFAGNETSLQQRDISANPTILSGDLNGDDDLEFSNIQDNSHHILTAMGKSNIITVDGFTIQGGGTRWDSNCLPEQCDGGGLCAFYSPLVVRRCVFHHNYSVVGGAIYTEGSSTTLIGCRIEQNETRSSGAGCYFIDADVSIFDCRFTDNVSQGFTSGALGIRAYYADDPISAIVANSVFINNGGPYRGGSISVAGGYGMNHVSSFLLTNCTVVGGFAEQCGGVFTEGAFDTTINNCLLWGNRDITQDVLDQQLGVYWYAYGLPGSISVNHSCIQGWDGSFNGYANTDANPRFANLAGLDSVLGTADDDVSLAAGSPCIDAGSNGVVPLDLFDLDSDGNTTEPLPFDVYGKPRFFDDPMAPDTGVGIAPIVDIGAIEYQADCNNNGILDSIDLFQGAADCDSNGVPDECQIDCDDNGQADTCQILDDPAADCNTNSILDACEYTPDCNSNGILDVCELDPDCNTNGIPDDCELGDNNQNDLNLNGVPDECESDCNTNAVPDDHDIASGTSNDCNSDLVPDECQLQDNDCNNDAIPDECQLQDNDCNANGIPDECDVNASPMSFASDTDLAGYSFSGLQAADINGDGYTDLVALDSDDPQAVALINDTTRKFAQTNGYQIGTNPAGLIVTDLSNDGFPDLVVFDQGQSDPGVYVRLNSGAGTFYPPTGYATGLNANDLAVGSMDDNDSPDLVVANNEDRTVAILLNYGDGQFANRRLVGTGAAPVEAVQLADFDNDGDLDIITYPKAPSERQATILINTEDGFFTDLHHLQLDTDRVEELQVVDLNNDNLPEIVVIHQYGTNVYVFENLGGGTFASSTAYPIANWPRGLGFADLNGDGFLDITVGSLAQLTLAVLINAQDGSFLPTEYYTAPDAVSITVAADFDGDRDIDVAGANTYGYTLSILANDGTGRFDTTYSFASGLRPHAILTADANNDSKPDIFTASSMNEGVTSLLNQTLPPLDPDYNSNGLLDQCEIAMFHDCLSGPAQTPAPTDHTPEQCLTTYDYDNNGNIDLLDFAQFQQEFSAR